MANLTLQYLDELSFVLHSRRLGQAKASSVGNLLEADEDRFSPWITQEESLMYGQERRPPYIIPRITSYRYPPHRTPAPVPAPRNLDFSQGSLAGSPLQLAVKEHRHSRLEPPPAPPAHPAPPGSYSPLSERGADDIHRDFGNLVDNTLRNKRSGSNENLLSPTRYGIHLGGADGSNPELRDPDLGRTRHCRSMLDASPHTRPTHLSPRVSALGTPPQNMMSTVFESKVKRTKLSENGKKLRKNWTENYLVLTRTHLIFFKDEKAYQNAVQRGAGTPPSPTGSSRGPVAELVISLHGATVARCTPQHTSRFAKSVVVGCGADQYLIQDESAAGAAFWLETISKATGQWVPEMSLMEIPVTPTANRKQSKKVGGSSNEDLSDSVDRTKVKKKLKKFLPRRPTKDQLIKKGVYKDEPVFGRCLEAVCPDGEHRVPLFVERCVHKIESSDENMHTDGLYRASGNLSQVQKIRLQIDQNNLDIVEQYNDVHVLTGSLKLFFRELKEPLIPCKLFNRTLAATGIKNRDARNKEFRDIVSSLPQCNYDTLKFLLEHLLRVTEHSAKNRMHISNLAIVFGPTLLWAPAELAHNIATDCIQQNHAIEILLTDFHEIFVKDRHDRNKKS